MIQKNRKEIIIYVLLTILGLLGLISLIYTIYLPIVFKSSRILILLIAIFLIISSIIFLLTSNLTSKAKIKQYLFYCGVVLILLSVVFSLSFAIPFAKSKQRNAFVQNKKGLSIEDINFNEKYKYYLYSKRKIQEFKVNDKLHIENLTKNKKIKIVKKDREIKIGNDIIKQDPTRISILTFERYENENRFKINEDRLIIETTKEPYINTIHKILLPSVFIKNNEEKEIIMFVDANVVIY